MKTSNEVQIYDTYERKKRVFVPLEAGKVKIYTCGPTVYDYPHIGNLRAYVFADILRRMFEFNGYEVTHVINITDVGHLRSDADEGEDKIEARAREQHRSAWDIVEFFADLFKQNLISLNIKSPTVWSRATEHIPEQIALIECLEKLGYTYKISDGVYFDTSKLAEYGHLARLDINGIMSGARVEENPEKRNPTDFALWKFSPKDQKRQMEWSSPWGVGFPGWHIECSAMAMKYLGETIDVHTGGIDHIPVHHTNEIAQSETATGKQFARYWMHVAFLTVDGGKMSKSLGNFYTLQDIVDKGYDPLAFRYLLLTAKYSAGLNFTWNGLGGSQKALSSLRERIAEWEDTNAKPDEELLGEFRGYLNDDLNTPQAVAFLWKVVGMTLPSAMKRATFAEFDKVLGLDFMKVKEDKIPDEVMVLVASRETLRKEGKWGEADKVRVELESKGYKIQDTKSGSRVQKMVV
ncbi:MAG: cysteine--tRNA ligase [bacterium]